MRTKTLVAVSVCCLLIGVGVLTFSFAIDRSHNAVLDRGQLKVVNGFWLVTLNGEDTHAFTAPYRTSNVKASGICNPSNVGTGASNSEPISVNESGFESKMADNDLRKFRDEIHQFQFSLLSVESYRNNGESAVLKIIYSIPEASKSTIQSYLRLAESEEGWKIVKHEYAPKSPWERIENRSCSNSTD